MDQVLYANKVNGTSGYDMTKYYLLKYEFTTKENWPIYKSKNDNRLYLPSFIVLGNRDEQYIVDIGYYNRIYLYEYFLEQYIFCIDRYSFKLMPYVTELEYKTRIITWKDLPMERIMLLEKDKKIQRGVIRKIKMIIKNNEMVKKSQKEAKQIVKDYVMKIRKKIDYKNKRRENRKQKRIEERNIKL